SMNTGVSASSSTTGSGRAKSPRASWRADSSRRRTRERRDTSSHSGPAAAARARATGANGLATIWGTNATAAAASDTIPATARLTFDGLGRGASSAITPPYSQDLLQRKLLRRAERAGVDPALGERGDELRRRSAEEVGGARAGLVDVLQQRRVIRL